MAVTPEQIQEWIKQNWTGSNYSDVADTMRTHGVSMDQMYQALPGQDHHLQQLRTVFEPPETPEQQAPEANPYSLHAAITGNAARINNANPASVTPFERYFERAKEGGLQPGNYDDSTARWGQGGGLSVTPIPVPISGGGGSMLPQPAVKPQNPTPLTRPQQVQTGPRLNLGNLYRFGRFGQQQQQPNFSQPTGDQNSLYNMLAGLYGFGGSGGRGGQTGGSPTQQYRLPNGEFNPTSNWMARNTGQFGGTSNYQGAGMPSWAGYGNRGVY